jgi:REP element-mobilizing transposase RayT
MITARALSFLRRFLPAEARRHGAAVLAMGAVCDHVHLLLRLPGAFDVPRLVQGLKGASARLVNQNPVVHPTGLRWATGYDARSVSPRSLSQVRDYVVRQPHHHPDRAIRTRP